MEVIRAQDTQKPSPGNTRIRVCLSNCGATCIETYVETTKFMGRSIGDWFTDEWPAGHYCPGCAAVIQAEKQVKIDAQQKRDEDRRREQQEERLLKMLGGDRPYDEYTFEKFEPIHSFTAFQRVKNFNPLADNLFIYGPTGTGKTHLAAALAREQMERGMDVGFYRVPPLMREFRRNLDPDDEERLIRKLGCTGVLIIDDLGVGKATEYLIEKLHEIVDFRLNHYMAGLVITSNLSLNGIAETFKDRIADRLNGLCELVKMEGQSQRKVKV